MNINEIAALAGVSRATVSRYLNNGYVSEDKKLRIQKIIDETGYQPSASAKTLRSKRTNVIGVIIPKINSDSISHMVAGISSSLNEQGYELLLACTSNHEAKELEYLNLFKDNRVDGIILLGTIFTEKHLKTLHRLQVPIVILAQNIPGYSCIYYDDYSATKDLSLALAPYGREFGYLGVTPSDIAVGKNRQKGFLDAMQTNGISSDCYHLTICDFNMDSGYKQAKELLTAYPDTDTLICATDTLAVGAMMYLRDARISIPDTVQVAGLNDSALSRVTTPSLTTVHFYYEESGKEAADTLIRLIAGPDSETDINKKIRLDYKLLLNGSTRTKKLFV